MHEVFHNSTLEKDVFLIRFRGEKTKKVMISPVLRSSSKPLTLPKKMTYKFISITPSKQLERVKRKKESGFKDQNLQEIYERLNQDLGFDKF